MAKPTTVRAPRHGLVWLLPWAGLVFVLNIAIPIWLLSFAVQFEVGGLFSLAFAHGFLAGVTLPYLINAVAIAMIIITAVLLFGGLTRKLPAFVTGIGDRVATEYESLSRRRFHLHIILWISIFAIMIFQFVPIYPLSPYFTVPVFFLIATRYMIPVFHLFEVVFPDFPYDGPLSNLRYASIPVTIRLGAALALSFGMFIWLLMATLRPNNTRLLKWILYAFALALALAAPIGIFPYFVWFEEGLSHASSHMAVFNFLAPTYLLLLVSLIWLSFQRTRLAALGARVKVWVRLIALGGIALQAVYLAFWSAFATQNANASNEVFYVGSALIAAGLAIAWLGLLLMVGARRKWDWALFGLVAATQIASLIVVYPGLLTV